MDPTRNPDAGAHLGPHHLRSAVRLQQNLSHWHLGSISVNIDAC